MNIISAFFYLKDIIFKVCICLQSVVTNSMAGYWYIWIVLLRSCTVLRQNYYRWTCFRWKQRRSWLLGVWLPVLEVENLTGCLNWILGAGLDLTLVFSGSGRILCVRMEEIIGVASPHDGFVVGKSLDKGKLKICDPRGLRDEISIRSSWAASVAWLCPSGAGKYLKIPGDTWRYWARLVLFCPSCQGGANFALLTLHSVSTIV